jgi:hypothetical protein
VHPDPITFRAFEADAVLLDTARERLVFGQLSGCQCTAVLIILEFSPEGPELLAQGMQADDIAAEAANVKACQDAMDVTYSEAVRLSRYSASGPATTSFIRSFIFSSWCASSTSR